MLGSEIIEHRRYSRIWKSIQEIVYKIEGGNNIDIETIGSLA